MFFSCNCPGSVGDVMKSTGLNLLDSGIGFRFKDSMNPDSTAEPSREELIALVVAQRAEIAVLKAQVTELERRLGLKQLEQRQAVRPRPVR
jgi:hypothetical protein